MTEMLGNIIEFSIAMFILFIGFKLVKEAVKGVCLSLWGIQFINHPLPRIRFNTLQLLLALVWLAFIYSIEYEINPDTAKRAVGTILGVALFYGFRFDPFDYEKEKPKRKQKTDPIVINYDSFLAGVNAWISLSAIADQQDAMRQTNENSNLDTPNN